MSEQQHTPTEQSDSSQRPLKLTTTHPGYIGTHPEQSSHFCDHWVKHPTDRWGGCWCKLPKGHTGPHSAHYPAEGRRS